MRATHSILPAKITKAVSRFISSLTAFVYIFSVVVVLVFVVEFSVVVAIYSRFGLN